MKFVAPKPVYRRPRGGKIKFEKTNEDHRLKEIMLEHLKKIYIRGHPKDSNLLKFLQDSKWYTEQAKSKLPNNGIKFEWLSQAELDLLRLSAASTAKLSSDITSRWKRRETSGNRSLRVFTHRSGLLKAQQGVRVRPNSVGIRKGSLLLI